MWSDHGKNFIGANRELRELMDFLKLQKNQGEILSSVHYKAFTGTLFNNMPLILGDYWKQRLKASRILSDVLFET